MTPKQLKQWRESNGYTQEQLGDALGIHPFSVSRWERGVREIPSFLLLALERLECMKGGEKKLRENKKKTEKEKGR